MEQERQVWLETRKERGGGGGGGFATLLCTMLWSLRVGWTVLVGHDGVEACRCREVHAMVEEDSSEGEEVG